MIIMTKLYLYITYMYVYIYMNNLNVLYIYRGLINKKIKKHVSINYLLFDYEQTGVVITY